MRASVGDHIVIGAHRVGEPARKCVVLEVRGQDGGPPYLVRWGDTEHEALFFPGADATVERDLSAAELDGAAERTPIWPRPGRDSELV